MYIDNNIKHTHRIFPMQNRGEYLRLDMNENPEGLPKEFVDKVKEKITPEFLSTYPEPNEFINEYAKFINFDSNQITITNGSDQAIRYILQTFGDKINHGEVLTVTPTFEMYDVNCNLLGLKHIAIQYNYDFSIDVDKISSSINDNTNIVVLLNPNNPIGNVYTDAEVKKIIEKAKHHNAIVVIDEAYHYFCKKTFINLINEYDNVIILRTFSKLCSLAAIRLGVIISNPNIIHFLNNLKLTFDVNSIALLFGLELVKNKELFNELIQIEREGRNYIIDELKKHNYYLYYAESNFICFKPKNKTVNELKELFFENKILVKTYSNSFLKDYIRISTGSKKIMKKFTDTLLDLDK